MLPALPARLRPQRPCDTGWFAGFGELEAGPAAACGYAADGGRFLGATFDPSGLYRFNAVQRWLDAVAWDVPRIHAHVRALQERLLDGLPDGRLARAVLLPAHHEVPDRGNFLTFRTPLAGALHARLAEERVVVDHRGDRLRIGLGVYHDTAAVDELLRRVERAVAAA